MTEGPMEPLPPDGPARFLVCPHCRVKLVLRPGQPAESSGPCPQCGVWIPSDGAGNSGLPQPSRQRRSVTRSRPPSRIPPDSIIDQRFSEQRETARTARILAWFLLAACVCGFVAWLLQSWVARK